MSQTTWTYRLRDLLSPGLIRIDQNKARLDKSILRTEKLTSSAFSRMSSKVQGFARNNIEAFTALDQIAPGITSTLTGIINPLTIAAAGVAVIGAGLVKATNKAEVFNNEFLELQNLNLNKTDAQIQNLNKNILRTGFAAGQGPKETSKAFFDIQSITGKFGQEVSRTAGKVGLFSRVMKVDFNSQVNAASVAMKTFGFGVNEVDKFLASSFKTVQVGKTTFEELARVQTDYAGAAQKSFQSFDSANQLFAFFTTRAKSVEEAATLTKSAFTDLFKESTIKAFKKTLDINLFDPVTGLPKQLDQIISESNKKFQQLGKGNPENINALVNQFKGSEGLVALIGAAAFNGKEFVKTIEDFKSTDFNIDKAIKNANGDLTQLKFLLGNQIDTILTRIGQTTLPTIVRGASSLITVIDKSVSVWDSLNEKSSVFRTIISGIGSVIDTAVIQPFRNLNLLVGGLYEFIGKEGAIGKKIFGDVDFYYQRLKTFVSNLFEASNKGIGALAKAGTGNFVGAAADFAAARNAFSDLSGSKERRRTGVDQASREADSRLRQLGINQSSADASKRLKQLTKNPSNTLSTNSNLKKTVNSVSGGSGSGRSVTVNIQKLVEKIEVHTTNLKEGTVDIQRQIEEVLIRAIRDSEVALSD